MASTQGGSKILGVLLIGFNPVVREGLQAILAKDEGLHSHYQIISRTKVAG